MANSYWLVNTSRSRVRRFKKNTDTREVIFPYMSVYHGKIVGMKPILKEQGQNQDNTEITQAKTIQQQTYYTNQNHTILLKKQDK